MMIGRSLATLADGLRVLLGILMASLAVPVAMQVLARQFGIIPVYLWTEELATFIFVWVVMVGAMLAVWDSTHFDVRVLPDAERPLLKLIQDGIVLVLMLLFGLLFAYYGIEYAQFGLLQSSTMMQANMIVTFISVPIAGVIWTIFLSYRLWEAWDTYRTLRGTKV